MNNIIKQLSQIEDQSVQLLETASAKKKELTKSYEEKTKQFDETLEAETEKKIAALQQEMEASMNLQLEKQQEDANAAVARLERHYETSHKRYMEHLFQRMIEV